jgi:hypothetical protein
VGKGKPLGFYFGMWRVKGVILSGLPKVPKKLVIGKSIEDAHHKQKEEKKKGLCGSPQLSNTSHNIHTKDCYE